MIGSNIKHIPLAGSNITKFIQDAIRDRGYNIAAEDMKGLAKELKDTMSYVAEDPVKEMAIWDTRFTKMKKGRKKQFKKLENFEYKSILSNKVYNVKPGYEVFMGPEMFFRPEIVSSDWSSPLDKEVDEAILLSPVNCRRNLYKNIILSGGSTLTTGL